MAVVREDLLEVSLRLHQNSEWPMMIRIITRITDDDSNDWWQYVTHPATLSPISSSRVFFWSELARTSLFAWKQIFLKKSVDGINNGQRSLLPAPRYRYSMPNLQCFCVFKTNSTVYNTTILTKPSQDIWIYVIMHWRLFLDVPCNFIVSGVAFLIHYIIPCLSSIAVPLSGIGQFWPIL